MIIKSIKLKNFQSYYGESNFLQFSKGLNLIIGSIASGKSKLFDAFYWTLNDKIYITGKDWVKSKDLNIELVNDRAKFEVKEIDELVETFTELVISENKSSSKRSEWEYTIRRHRARGR